jgi:hypothetical protein
MAVFAVQSVAPKAKALPSAQQQGAAAAELAAAELAAAALLEEEQREAEAKRVSSGAWEPC